MQVAPIETICCSSCWTRFAPYRMQVTGVFTNRYARVHVDEHRFELVSFARISFHDSNNHRSVSGGPHKQPANANQETYIFFFWTSMRCKLLVFQKSGKLRILCKPHREYNYCEIVILSVQILNSRSSLLVTNRWNRRYKISFSLYSYKFVRYLSFMNRNTVLQYSLSCNRIFCSYWIFFLVN